MIQIDTFGSDFDTVLVVWTGDELSNLTSIAENDQFNGDQSAVYFHAMAGVTYRIAIYGWGNDGDYDQGNISLNIAIDSSSRITGTVTGPDGTTPLAGIAIYAYVFQEVFSQWGSYNIWQQVSYGTQTQSDGSYTIGGLSAGTYRVEFSDWSGNFIGSYYDDATTVEDATDIVVGEAATVSEINASLAAASRIAGTVTGPDGSTPLANISISAYVFQGYFWQWVSGTQTQSDGSYTISGLSAGTYRVEFSDWSGNFIGSYYDDATTVEDATDIVVGEATTVSEINASLAAASQITGTVTGPDGSTPLGDIFVRVWAYLPNEFFGGWWQPVGFSAQTQSDGSYTISGLIAGTYRVEFYDWSESFIGSYYDGATTVDNATDIVVGEAATVSGINGSLHISETTPPHVSGFRKTGPNSFDLDFTGTWGLLYQLEESTDLADWTAVGEPFICAPGLNIIPLSSSEPAMFWRVVLVP